MRQRLYDYLLERPSGATVDELFALVFSGGGRDPEFGGRFLDALLGRDQRFRFSSDDRRWRARVHDDLARPLAATTFVVVDLETTGGAPGSGGIIEIGAVRVTDGKLGATFQTLVNPGRPIPPFVVGLTGITDAMVADAPRIGPALAAFLDFAGDAVLVAHNAPFDMGHLDAAHQVHVGRPLVRPAVCTIRLTRRLIPELKRRALDAVASHLGIACWDRHRGLGDANITAEILCVLLERAAAMGVAHLDQLIDLERAASDGRPFIVHVARDKLHDVPARPGVYHLLGNDGRLLYVGKARRLRDRLQGWFSNARGHTPRTLEMLRQVYDFRLTETGSELAASLLEMRQIRELKPPYNRAGKQVPRVGFLKLSVRSAWPRLSVTQRLGVDRAVYVGPFPSKATAERAQAVLARVFGLRTCGDRLAPSADVSPCLLGQVGTCPAPCAGRIGQADYGANVRAALAFVEGHDDAARTTLHAKRDADAAALRFEAAARAQRDVEVLDDIWRRRERLAWVVGRQNFVVLLPTADRSAAQLYAVLGGRLALESRVDAAADLLAAVRVVRERYHRFQDTPLERGDVDASTILSAWLRDRAQEGLVLTLDGPDALARRLDELSITLDDLLQRGPLPPIDQLA